MHATSYHSAEDRQSRDNPQVDEIKIRAAGPNDRQAITAMFLSTVREAGVFAQEIDPTPEASESYFENLIWPAMVAGDPILVATNAGEVIGGICAIVNRAPFVSRERSAAEHMVYVAPGYRSMGVATSLRKAAIRMLQEQGVRRLQTYCYTGNKPALRALRRIGARPAGTVFDLPLEC